MADGGLDPVDPNSFEMNEDTPDDDPSEDIPLTDNDTEFSQPEGSQQETSFTTPEVSQESRWIELYRDRFNSKYGIDDQTFTELRLDLKLRGGNLYYKDAQIMCKGGKGLYALSGIKGKGATHFKNIIKYGKHRVQKRLIEESRRSKKPIEPTAVDRQSRTSQRLMTEMMTNLLNV